MGCTAGVAKSRTRLKQRGTSTHRRVHGKRPGDGTPHAATTQFWSLKPHERARSHLQDTPGPRSAGWGAASSIPGQARPQAESNECFEHKTEPDRL